VNSLYTAIKQLTDEIDNPDSIVNRTAASKKKELIRLGKNSEGAVLQLSKLLIKYKSLRTNRKRTWDKIRFVTENLQDVRQAIMTHTSSLQLFLTTLGTGSLGRIEKKLHELIADVRAGRREETVLTIADDDDDESEKQWNIWKSELVDDGFTKVELEGNKQWIKARILELIRNGDLQERPLQEERDSSKSKAKDESESSKQ
jgi:hypothetical protein